MTIKLNGEAREVAATTLDALLVELGLADAVVATARNCDFVAKEDRPATPVVDGDAIEIVAPMQGG
ncbi:sulfur carrier protein ThiS [Aurantimonas sp. C2-6-R+9]|uniref:Sulfur carrier protein ThiS n=2 Tax=root TaxID=1 RepID=A0A9C9NIK1_9HYPH|nr:MULTISPECIES: sulfur carrier protein ThiS [unclassified Aurantimonas]MEC5290180.1 sulfur carrier protein ThiS [Aurantimonas sp. C2-3-R2]MEC5380292.1 sulfur carrier protein ThiS [Aurantimonas sp. C2-6-R+9]MEC5411244.1 sulfur carrier protein ThiS [Aurantimonas sp. C2-4-R8]HDZ71243.1 sulfur carrier protein ThiS [Aurantimonas coralicida]HEU02138.1 sulfur carrier protein ThiS [Aurantimonas coralicida]